MRRVYPGYIAATTIGAFIIIPMFSTVYLLTPLEVTKTIGLNLLLRGYSPPSTVFARNYSQALNGSLWSIPYEFWCYGAVAMLGFVRVLRTPAIVISIVAVSITSRATLDFLDKKPGLGLIGVILGWPYLWLAILPWFFVGSACLLLRDEIPRSKYLLAFLIFFFFAACYLPLSATLQKVATEAIFPFSLAYSVFYFSFSDGVRIRRAAALGDFSYGTYLFAFPIQQMLLSVGLSSVAFPAFVTCSLMLSLAAGILSWHLIEKWFLPKRTPSPATHDFHLQPNPLSTVKQQSKQVA